MFKELKTEIKIFEHPNLWLDDVPQLRDHWATLQNGGNTSEITLWRFYIASLIAIRFLELDNLPEDIEIIINDFLLDGVCTRKYRLHGRPRDHQKFLLTLENS